MTAVPDNIKMWRKYSNRFNGFCVGFNSKKLFKGMGGGGKVEYVKNLPVIHPFAPAIEKRTLLTFFKLNKWKFEKEYRLQNFWPNPIGDDERKWKFPKESFCEIILGEKLSNKSKQQLIAFALALNPKVEIKLASKENNFVLIKPFA